jgi:sugar/nucleoside kinase (ribokinase family)
LAYLLRYVKLAVCSRGKRGCVAMNAEGERSESRAEGVEAIDTTGAGDTFTSGFLHAYLAGGSLRQCGDAGCAAGAEVVQVRGAEMDDDRWRRVREKIAIILGKERSPSATT